MSSFDSCPNVNLKLKVGFLLLQLKDMYYICGDIKMIS